MLAAKLGVRCSRRCESLIAIAFLFSPEKVLDLAERVVQDEARSAISLAEQILSIAESEARELAVETLLSVGFCREEIV